MLRTLAFDYGASSGRAILGIYDGSTLKLEEMHRFANEPVIIRNSFHWDLPRLYHEMKQGIQKCVSSGFKDISCIGIDTWGVDFGLIDKRGDLLGIPYHYRDSRTDGIIDEVCSMIPRREIYNTTGNQFEQFNSLFQLMAMKKANSPLLDIADKMLFMPDLMNYFLTGEKYCEYTIASTSQMLDAKKRDWAIDMLSRLGIPEKILSKIVYPGNIIGELTSSVMEETGIGKVPVAAVAEHDTGSAVLSVPAIEGRFAYLSSGTWSLLGIESDQPIINDMSYDMNYTNEGGFGGNIRFLKNIMGLWIYQELKRTWEKEDAKKLSFDDLEMEAIACKPFKAFVNVDSNLFFSPGNMPEKVRRYCRETGQEIPETRGEIVRVVLEGLALKYRYAIEGLEQVVGASIPVLNIVGGGSKNIPLCKFTANAINRQVVTGPVEATAIGNLLCQLIALGEISNKKQARELVKNSFPTEEYIPEDTSSWEDAYGRYVSFIKVN
jgi:rhamnulokinase